MRSTSPFSAIRYRVQACRRGLSSQELHGRLPLPKSQATIAVGHGAPVGPQPVGWFCRRLANCAFRIIIIIHNSCREFKIVDHRRGDRRRTPTESNRDHEC